MIDANASCTGCSACRIACPVGAISMVPDEMGFPRPQVDAELCINCLNCEEICTRIRELPRNAALHVLAVRLKDTERLARSQSGGVFSALSDIILASGGHIYGCAMQDDFSAAHEMACDASGRDRMLGSKYVQSRMGDCLEYVLDDLREGRKVLFSGTPCQCRAVKAVAGPSLESSLLLVDIVCHGVPAPRVWQDYLNYVAHGRTIDSVDFRDKSYGWKSHVETIRFENGSTYRSRSYADLYYKHLMLRSSCGECLDNCRERVTDLTIGDLWGLEKKMQEIYKENRGWSLVLTHTSKGAEALEAAKDKLETMEVELKDCLQPPLRIHSAISPDAGRFASDLKLKGMGYVLRIYGDHNVRSRFRYLYKNVRRKLRKMLGKV